MILSLDIDDQKILQSDWKKDTTLNNTNFYLSLFPAKVIGKIFQNKEKTLFWGHFCPKVIFPKISTTAVVPQHLNVKDTE